MTLSSALRIADRFVKIQADRGEPADGGRYRHSSGFVIRDGVVLTSAHGLAGARSIRITDRRGDAYPVPVDAADVWSGDPAGPAADRAPDVAVLSVPGLGAGLRPFPVARLNRADPPLRTLRDVQVVGFPRFTEDGRRQSFHDVGSISLLTYAESGMADVSLSATPAEIDPRDEVASQWSGISGAPVIVDGHLIAVITEHATRTGPARLAAIPLTLLDPDPEPARHSPGVPDPAAWWRRLGVDEPGRLPALPGTAARAAWVDDLRLLADELSDQGLPPAARDPATFAAQAHEALLECFGEPDEPDFRELARRLRDALARPAAAPGVSVYALATTEVVTAGTLPGLLDRLLRVHAATGLPAPGLDRLRYRISAPRVDLADPERELAAWAGRARDRKLAAALLDRLDPLDDRPGADALGELLAALANAEWNPCEPWRAVRALVDLIFTDDLDGPDGQVAEAIKDCFETPDPAARGAVMLSRADREPRGVVHDEDGFLVNEQPTLVHLRHGFFAPAEELDRIEAGYWSWYAAEVAGGARRRSGRVPTFWLTGPSGAGKSILLLQLLARLNARPGVSVLWLGSDSDHLALGAEQALPLSRDRHVVIGVDDPLAQTYSGGELGWRHALAKLNPRRQTDLPGTLPVFICCAPTEHYERFRQAHAGEVQVEKYVLDPYRPEFTGGLRSWYERRTGRTVQAPTRDGTLLPAQLFFEWWKGEGIEAFARRFRDRITARGLPDLTVFFERLLAVNRLYVGCPSQVVDALPAEARDALAAFQLDMHVHRPQATRPGYWLSHPHLANLIYEEWFPAGGNARLQGDHLAAALLDAVRLGDEYGWASLPLLEQLLAHGPGQTTATDGRVRVEHVVAALVQAAAAAAGTAAVLANPVLATWVKIDRRIPGGLPAWRPLADAVARLGRAHEDELGLPVLVSTLAGVQDAAVDEAVWSFLRDHPGWRDWLRTATLLADRPIPAGHLATLLAGIRHRPGEAGAIELLCLALRHRPAAADLRAFAGELLLDPAGGSAPLAPLAVELYAIGGEGVDAAIAWLRAAVRPENGTLFTAVLKQRTVPLIVLPELTQWLVAHPLEEAADAGFAFALNNWQQVRKPKFQRALARHLDDRDSRAAPSLLESVHALLRQDHKSWSFLFGALTAAQVRRPEMRSAALSWLRRNPSVSSWGRVYDHVCGSLDGPESELYALGHARLPTVGQRAACGFLLRAMFRVCPPRERAAWAGTALSWLTDNPDDEEGWGFLAGPIVSATASADAAAVSTTILRWWEGHQESHSASYVIRTVLNAAPDQVRRDAVDRVGTWLAVHHPGWGHVFLDLLPHIPTERAVAIALPWLERHLGDDRWAAVFHDVVTLLRADQVAALGRLWFAHGADADSTAGFVWRLVLEEGPCGHLLHDPAFRQTVNAWLVAHGRQKSWWHIWRSTHLARPADLATVRAALDAGLPTERSHGVANALRRSVAAGPERADALWEMLGDADRDTDRGVTWQLTVLHLTMVAPTERAWELALDHLRDIETRLFSPWWRRLWNAFPDEAHRTVLRRRARAWLAEHPDETSGHKVLAKLEKDDAQRVTPATVFGPRRRAIPPAPTPTPTSAPTPTPQAAADAVPHLPAAVPPGSTGRTFECGHCGNPVEIRDAKGDAVRQFVCTRCGTHQAVDPAAGTVTILGNLVRRAATPVDSTAKDVRRARAYVHCDVCDGVLLAVIRTPDAHFAIDQRCGYLHEVPVELLASWLAERRAAEATPEATPEALSQAG